MALVWVVAIWLMGMITWQFVRSGRKNRSKKDND